MNQPSGMTQVYEQSIYIATSPERVEETIIDPVLMHRWLNPLLKCTPIGNWNTQVGSEFQFAISLPLWQPSLTATVCERQSGLIVWSFTGFFQGKDRWQCSSESQGTRLLNRFEFKIDNALVAFGFNTFAAKLTRQDMQAQLQRLKRVAEAG
jgi:hypothetical protein